MKKIITLLAAGVCLNVNAQIITAVAGDSIGGYNGDAALATSKYLNNPFGVATDQNRNIYIADMANNRVRKVTISTGLITTIAGNGAFGFSGDNGNATAAKLAAPYGVAVDAAGNIYIADRSNSRIRRVDASGTITTIAGTSSAGYSGDNSAANAAQLSAPTGVALDATGNLYIADYANNVIRKITISTGIITTVAGNGTQGYNGDNNAAISANLYHPTGVSIDASGNIYIADNGNNVVRKVTLSTGFITTIAGNNTQGFSGDNGSATSAQLNHPWGVAVVGANLYVSDYANFRIRKVSSTGTITTVVGNGTNSYTGNCGNPTAANLSYPAGLASDNYGNLYIADYNNNGIREVLFTATKVVVTPHMNVVIPCSGAGVIFTGSGAQTYVWSNGVIDGASSPAPVNTSTGVVVYSYSVTGTDTNQCFASARISFSVNPLPTIYAPNNTPTVCVGQSVTLTAVDVNGTASASVTPTNAATFSWTGGITNGVAFTPNATTTYVVTGTDLSTGCSSTNSNLITVVPAGGPLPVISLSSSGAISTCGSSATLTASGATTYTWLPGNNLTGTNISVTPSASTTYTVTGTAHGCVATNTITQQVNVITVTSTKDTLCKGSSVVLSASGATNYTWTIPPTSITSTVTTTSAGTSTITGNPTYTSTYTITGSSATGTATCTSATYFTQIVRVLNLSSSKDSLCNGSAVTLTASGASTYSWSTSSQHTATISVTPTVTTTYTVTGTASGCNISNTIQQIVKPPFSVIVISNKDSICVGDSARLTVTGASSYIWSTTQTNPSITVKPTVTTNYLVSGTKNGCSISTNFNQKVGNCTVGIKQITGAASQIILYPNPVVNGSFTVLLSESTVNTTIYVINAIGQKVYETKSNGLETKIEMPNYQPGVYFVQIKNTNGTSVKKVIIN